MQRADSGKSATSLKGRLQRFCDEHCAVQQKRLDELPFIMVSVSSSRKGHAAILAHASKALTAYENADTLITAAELVLLNDIGPIKHDSILKTFGDEIAVLVANASTHFDQETGYADLWESSLQQLAKTSVEAQRVRLALLLGQVTHSPHAFTHLPFWYKEAEVLSRGDPALQRQVMKRIETAS
ncbi:hypothetical protein QC823_01485 [Halomonas vilamensis]|uniref:Uncharacterized protein n=1 Tax=Vreelandella vilamensis TaxID=531309 RepID=A0ABU1H0A6_9GAMM|nr:hypothetical protein [Halomonas vilamensis]MDR5897669.1 hypothetical protein [Halomonas vilamensis]